MALKRVRLGRIYAHPVTFPEAVEEVAAMIRGGLGGYVVTPNVDHVVQAEHNDALAAAYDQASLSVVDGQPLMWLSRLMGAPFPQKISGSDLVPELMKRSAREGWRVVFLGAAEGVGAEAANVLRKAHPDLEIVATLSPRFGFDEDPEERASILRKVCDAKPDLVIMALGCPQEKDAPPLACRPLHELRD
ncbi:MAG: WecB/TagA/CpsF family glycosyltransferase, partial [Polyangiales bacterium]